MSVVPTPPYSAPSPASPRENRDSPEARASVRSVLTNPALLRAMVRSLPTTGSSSHSTPTTDDEQTPVPDSTGPGPLSRSRRRR